MPYADCHITGPYIRPSDNRKVMAITYPDGRKSNVTYARYYMECLQGRLLDSNEIVHHIDGDHTNDEPSNFEIKTCLEHNRGHHNSYIEDAEIPCVSCGTIVLATIKQQQNLTRNAKWGKRGPYCLSCRTKSPFRFKPY